MPMLYTVVCRAVATSARAGPAASTSAVCSSAGAPPNAAPHSATAASSVAGWRPARPRASIATAMTARATAMARPRWAAGTIRAAYAGQHRPQRAAHDARQQPGREDQRVPVDCLSRNRDALLRYLAAIRGPLQDRAGEQGDLVG